MSRGELPEYERPKFRDFTPIGLEGPVVDDLRADIAFDNPSRYENLSAWVELIIEAARQVESPHPLDVEELQGYLHPVIVPPNTTWNDELGQAERRFVSALNDNAVADGDYYRTNSFGPDEYGENYGSYHYRRWQFADETVAGYVAARAEYDELGLQAEELHKRIRSDASEASINDLLAIYETLTPIVERREALKNGPEPTYNEYGSDFSSSWRRGSRYYSGRREYDGNWPNLDLANYIFPQSQLREVHDRLEARLDTELHVQAAVDAIEVDKENHQRFGAKAANLLHIQAMLDELRKSGHSLTDVLSIPPFMAIDTDVFRRWQSGERITQTVLDVVSWMTEQDSSKAYLLRSSAVHSEDGEHMGAGVYESALVEPPLRPRDVLMALRHVYHSTHSPKAQLYRQAIGVEDEAMGVVVQQAGAPDYYGEHTMVTFNTMMPGAPRLADYTIEVGDHPLSRTDESSGARRSTLHLDRNGMFLDFGVQDAMAEYDAPRFHTPPDVKKHFIRDSWYTIQAGILAERLFGQPVQIEGVLQDDGIQLVQARPLPDRMLEPEPFVGFPEYDKDDELWYKGRGVGVINGVQAFVDQHGSYRFRNGHSYRELVSRDYEIPDGTDTSTSLIVWDDSFAQSGIIEQVENYVLAMSPDERERVVCLIKNPPSYGGGSGYGHLETFFGEMGIRTIFAGPNGSRQKHFAEGQQVTVYSDGYTGIVLSSEDDPAYKAYLQEHNKNIIWDDEELSE